MELTLGGLVVRLLAAIGVVTIYVLLASGFWHYLLRGQPRVTDVPIPEDPSDEHLDRIIRDATYGEPLPPNRTLELVEAFRAERERRRSRGRQDGYQPSVSTTSPSNPPKGGSGYTPPRGAV